MAFLGLFETAQEKKERTIREMKNRVVQELKKGKLIDEAYNQEVQKLYTIVDNIVTPPSNVWKKDRYRNKQAQVLKSMIEDCEACFSKDIDNKLKDTVVFQEAITKAKNAEKREAICDQIRQFQVASNRNLMGRRDYLSHFEFSMPDNEQQFPAFHVSDVVSAQLGAAELLEDAEKLKYIENNVHNTIRDAMEKFDPAGILKKKEDLLSDDEKQRLRIYNDRVIHYNNLKSIMKSDKAKNGDACYSAKNIESIRELVTVLKLDSDANSPLKNILQKNGSSDDEISGLDFMVKYYPNILVDVLLDKLLADIDREALSFVNDGNDFSLLNSKDYVAMHARRKALSQTLSSVPTSLDAVYKKYFVTNTDDPNVFSTFKKIDKRIEDEKKQEYEKKNPLSSIETDVDKEMRSALSNYEPRGILDDKMSQKMKEGIEGNVKVYHSLAEMLDNPSDCKKRIKELALELKIEHSLNDTIDQLLKRKEIVGSTGLDFLVQCHPNILLYEMLIEVSKRIDHAFIAFVVEKKDPALLKSKQYVDLYACEKALLRIESGTDLIWHDLWGEYNIFTGLSSPKRFIGRELKNLYSKENATDKKFDRLHAIVDRLQKYTTFDQKEPNREARLKSAENILKKWDECYIDMMDLRDFYYLVKSDAGIPYKNSYNDEDAIDKVDDNNNTVTLNGIDYMLQNCPNVFGNYMPYVLLRQLGQEVDRLGDIPGFQKEYFKNLMILKKNLEKKVRGGQSTLEKKREEYDKKFDKLLEKFPGFYLNTNVWWKLGEFKDRYSKKDHKDPNLVKCLDARYKAVDKVDEAADIGPRWSRLKNRGFKETGEDNFNLQGIKTPSYSKLENTWDWTNILHLMFDYKGIYITPRYIRGYTPVLSYKNVDKPERMEVYDQNMELFSDLGCHMNLVSKLFPNTAMHKITFRLSENETAENVKRRLKTIIVEVVKGEKTPLAMNMGGHYKLIYGLNDESVRFLKLCRDFDKDVVCLSSVDINGLARDILKEKTVDLYWLSDIKVKDDKTDFKIERKLGEKADRIGRLQYDSDGILHDMIYEQEDHLQDLDQYMKNTNDSSIAKDNLDPEYEHENYEVFRIDSKGKFESEQIYLPKKLKLSGKILLSRQGVDGKHEKLSEGKIDELKEKVRNTYERFEEVCGTSNRKGGFFTKKDAQIVDEACKAYFDMISLYLGGKVPITLEERCLLDQHMSEILQALRSVQVDDNQSDTLTTRFFNAIGWSSNKPTICEDINEKLNANEEYPNKMFHTMRPVRGVPMKEMVKQLVGTGEHTRQYYNSSGCSYGEGFYTASVNSERKPVESDEAASRVSWVYGKEKDSIQFTLALNEHAKVIDDELVKDELEDFESQFVNTYDVLNDDRSGQNIILAFMGFNTVAAKQAGEQFLYYCITDRKVLNMHSLIKIRTCNREQGDHFEKKTLDEYTR